MSEDYAARPHPEFVVLDIGDDVGALIVRTDADLHGLEVEISPDGHDDRRTHKEVLERSAGGRPAFTVVFDQLTEGRYTLWTEGIARARGVAISGGTIAELDWTGAAAPSRRSPGGAERQGHEHGHERGHEHGHERGHAHGHERGPGRGRDYRPREPA